MKMLYIMFCLLFGTTPSVANNQSMAICAQSAGLASQIQFIRIEETEKNETHTFEDFRKGVAQGYKNDGNFSMFIIIGNYVYNSFNINQSPDEVHEFVRQDCVKQFEIKKAPTKEPKQEGDSV